MTDWHTAETGAEYVRLSERSVRDAVRAGDLPAYKVGTGREYRLKQSDLDEWLEARPWEPRSA